jgi:sporulation protein YlmC with PRC-barrel domain
MNKFLLSAAVAATLALALPAIAQQKAPEAPKVQIPTKTFVKEQRPGQTLARDRLIGAKVLNKEGNVIGDIEDLILDGDNKIIGVVMGVGGFLGAGEKKVGVQYGALVFGTKDAKPTISLPLATKEVLAALEPYKRLEPRATLLQRAADKAKELADKTKETVKDATKKAGETAADLTKKAKEAAQPAPAEPKKP